MAIMKTTREVKGVGLSIPRADGADKVTGHVQYVADIKPPVLISDAAAYAVLIGASAP
jgi:CO/xanthine dehydrogenase Mo-binding subunit